MGFTHKNISIKEGATLAIPINKEYGYLKIIGFTSPTHSVEEIRKSKTRIKYEGYKKYDSGTIDGTIGSFIAFDENPIQKGLIRINKEFDVLYFDCVKLTFEDVDLENLEIELLYDTKNLFLPVSDPRAEFQKFLDNGQNSKILFSAPFGQGKTTFLKFFFNPSEEKYGCFHLYPVNYSVAKNEDIFRYIKTEILFQLLYKDVSFDKVEIPYLTTLTQFLGGNAYQILSPFVKMIPDIGGNVFNVIDKLIELIKKYFVEHEKSQIDEEKEAKKYLKEIYEQEGSIYEDNFYTQLIRQLLDQIKAEGKQTVLVIDDLDRMDPDHLFRILNVFAAHFDHDESDEFTNKFGFDKVIIVCDYDNLRKIFYHKYGPNTDYRGYVDKFFSRGIFRYDNQKAIATICRNIREVYGQNNDGHTFDIYMLILNDLIETNQLSLRELLRLQKADHRTIPVVHDYHHLYSPIYFLNQVLDIETILTKIKNCIQLCKTDIDKKSQYYFYMWHLIIPIGSKNYGNNECTITYKHQNIQLEFKTTRSLREAEIVSRSIRVNGEEKSNDIDKFFNVKDFYSILYDLALSYRENEGEILRLSGKN